MAWLFYGFSFYSCRASGLVNMSEAFSKYNIWEHSQIVKDLYLKRALDEAEEMTCAQQALELLLPHLSSGEKLVDVGCGSGYFYHTLRKRHVKVDYHGVDQTECLIKIGQENLPRFGLPPEKLSVCRLEDYDGQADHFLCMNVLSNIDNYHKPLERLLRCANKTVILRESISEQSAYHYVRDEFLDEGVNLKVHVNTYGQEELADFIKSYGFDVQFVLDQRTQGKPEMVIGYPHHWTFVIARKI